MSQQVLTTEQTLATTISQQQVRFVRMVEMTAPEVEEAVQKELEENPALEVKQPEEAPSALAQSGRSAVGAGKSYEFYDKGDTSESLYEYVSSQLSVKDVPVNVAMAAHYIAGNLDANGYISRSLTLIANDIYLSEGVDLTDEEMRRGLEVVQSLDPAGVAARDVAECLQLQLKRIIPSLPSGSDTEKKTVLALAIVTQQMEALSLHHYHIIAHRLKVSDSDVKEAVDTIRRLNPKPGAAFGGTPQEWNYVIPDFIISISNNKEISISLNNSIPELAISRSFEEAVAEMQQARRERKEVRKEKEFIVDRYSNAREFIKVLRRRQETLMNVMTAIAEIQHDYLVTADEALLRPMGLKDVAAATGYDLSLVSRSTSNKHIALPWGVFPLRFFFSETFNATDGKDVVSGRNLESAIRHLVETEDKAHPLSDDAITRMLNRQGLDVSRRTVNKYRDRLNIPPARLRKLSER